MRLNQDFVRLTREIRGSEKMPSQTRYLTVLPSETWSRGSVNHYATTHPITDERLDGVGFVERHDPIADPRKVAFTL